MNFSFDVTNIGSYKKSQLVRVLSESWALKNLYCPHCGKKPLKQFTANKEVADFYCEFCNEEYELKSEERTTLGSRITAGAYGAMIRRLSEKNKPNFIFLTYKKPEFQITNVVTIPKQFFIPEIIQERPKLSETARRAGWIGCYIHLQTIPYEGKIFIIKNNEIQAKDEVLELWRKTVFLRQESVETKGWLIDLMNCIEELDKKEFSLTEIYAFEKELQQKHLDNRHIKPKIRQQLQKLRDNKYLEFTSPGKYRLL